MVRIFFSNIYFPKYFTVLTALDNILINTMGDNSVSVMPLITALFTCMIWMLLFTG